MGYLAGSHFFSVLLSELPFSYLFIILLTFHFQPLGSFYLTDLLSFILQGK